MRSIVVLFLFLLVASMGLGLGGQSLSVDGGSVEAVTRMETIVPLASAATDISINIPPSGKISFNIFPGANSVSSTLSIQANGGWKLMAKSINSVSGANLYNSDRTRSLSQPLKVSVKNPKLGDLYTASTALATDDKDILIQQDATTGFKDLVPIYSQAVTSSDSLFSNKNVYSTIVTWTATSDAF